MIEWEFIKKCVELGVPQDMAEMYVIKTQKESYTEYDIKAIREAADYEGRLKQ